jgi:uncharacterized membrane protein YhaH (DUF805 family)
MIESILENLLEYKGRQRRRDYGAIILSYITLLIGLVLIGILVYSGPPFPVFLTTILIAVYVFFIPIQILAGIKRLHDTNNNPWLLTLLIVPFVGSALWFYLLFADGTVGPNPYGPDPKRPETST